MTVRYEVGDTRQVVSTLPDSGSVPQRHRLAPANPAVGALGDKVRPSTSYITAGDTLPESGGSTSTRCAARLQRLR